MSDFVEPLYVSGGYFLSDTPDVQLTLRLGPVGSARRQRRYAGSDVLVWCDITNRITDEIIADALGFSGLFWLPGTVPGQVVGQVLTVEEVEPGLLLAVVPSVMPGTYAVHFRAELPMAAVGGITFDVAS